MYNHYIPQSDGSYRRSTVPEGSRRNSQQRPQQSQQHQPPSQQHPEPPPQRPKPEPIPEPPTLCPPPKRPESCQNSGEGILSFLKGLLPRQIDTADLLVILLILLMNRDEEQDSFSPMLTLALYFLL